MKLIIAIIQPQRLEQVKKALYDADINLLTVSEV
jgi:nitrogen regulatory protein PII